VRAWLLFAQLATPAAYAQTAPALWAADPLPVSALTADAAAAFPTDDFSNEEDLPDAEDAEGAVHALPGGPSSVSLMLCALSGLGAWRLGRGGLRATFGQTPEWYHDGGPWQVGHARALDLTFSHDDLPVCVFEALAPLGEPRAIRVEPELPPSARATPLRSERDPDLPVKETEIAAAIGRL
jgi:hypothetical protein